MRLVHVVNTSDFVHAPGMRRAQSVTLGTMELARQYARSAGIHVDQVAVCFSDERAVLPDGILERDGLRSSVQDHVPGAPRRLPLIAEILAIGLEGADASHAIYTNVDISLVPHFYVAVAAMLAAGDPSLIVNRRTIPDFANRRTLPALEVMASFAGRPHPGRDCFAFPLDAVEQFVVGRTVIGADGVGRVLQWNLEAVCGPVTWRKDLHLTFHLGDDQPWRDPAHAAVNTFNLRETVAVYDALVERHGPFERFSRGPTAP